MDPYIVAFGGLLSALWLGGLIGAVWAAIQGGEEMAEPTPAEQIAELQRRLAALEGAPAPSGSLGAVVNSALQGLGKPDSVVMASIRHAATAGGALLIARGYADNSGVTELIGALMAVAAVAWSILSKYVAERWLHVAVASPADTTIPQVAAIAAQMPSGPVTAENVAAAAARVDAKS